MIPFFPWSSCPPINRSFDLSSLYKITGTSTFVHMSAQYSTTQHHYYQYDYDYDYDYDYYVYYHNIVLNHTVQA
jgi:hypothetical protein